MNAVGSVRGALATVRTADVLGARPCRAIARLAACSMRHGGSLFTLAAWMSARAPDSPAAVDADGMVTFGELVRRSVRRSDLVEHSFPGPQRPRIALLGRNSIAYVEWLLACGRLGADLVLLNPAMAAAQLASVCRVRPPDLVICDSEFREVVEHAGLPVRCIEPWSAATAPQRDEPSSRWPTPGSIARIRQWRRRRRGTITVLTSGTTGPSALVAQRPSPIALARISLALVDRLGLRAGQPTLLTVPLLHGHGLATIGLSMAMGSPLHLVASTHGPEILERIDEHDIAVAVLVPTILHRLIEAVTAAGAGGTTAADVPPIGASLRAIVCGSAPLSAALATRTLATFGPVLFNLYGTSESGLVSLATPGDLRSAPGTVGRVLPGVTVRIVGADDRDAAVGEVGHVLVYARQVHDGFDTGDLGHRDTAGLLFLHGRADDLIVRGGENLFPQMIEDRVIAQFGGVQECAVVAVNDDSEFGSQLHLFAVLTPGCHDTTESLLRQFEQQLPRVIRPTRLTVVDALPRNLSGEIVRRRLAQLSA